MRVQGVRQDGKEVKELGIKVSIIIVNWNGIRHLPTCLTSLAAQTFKDFEVIVVDNGSTDGSVDLVRREYPCVKLVILSENHGFAGGNNAGFHRAEGEYIVTLNNDTRAEPDWLATLVAVAENHPEVGMVGSRVCSSDDPDRVDSLGVRVAADGMSRGAFRGSLFSELDLKPMEEIFFPSACAALYRRKMLDDVGFFDEEFFAYCEDTDLGLRGRLAGWGAQLARDAVVLHSYSATSGNFSPFKLYLVERNHYWVVLKNFPPQRLLLLPAFTLFRFLVQASTVLAGQGVGGEFRSSGSRGRLLWALVRGGLDAIVGIPRLLAKRRKVMASARLSGKEMEKLLLRYRISFRELLDAGL